MDIKMIVMVELIMLLFMTIFMKIINDTKYKIDGITSWLYSYIHLFFGLILLGMRGYIPTFFSITIANLLLVVGIFMFYVGLRKNRGEKVNKKIHYTFFICFTIYMFYYSEINPILRYRVIMVSTFFAIYFLLLSLESLKYKNKLKWISFGIYFINFAVESIEVIYYLFRSIGNNFFELTGLAIISFGVHGLTIPLNIITIFIIVVNELLEELQYKIRSTEESKNKVEELLKQQKELALTISHNLKTPLNGIMGTAEMGLISKDEKKRTEYIESIYKSSKYLLRLINRILITRTSKEKISFSIKELLLEKGNLLKKECSDKGILLLWYSSLKIPERVEGSFNTIEQILYNIIGNAIKYTEKGMIYVSANVSEFKGKKVKITFRIEDTGIGISKENIEKIYDMMYVEDLKRRDSFGIGLYNVKKLIDSLDGNIRVNSKKGIGTMFEVDLDLDVIEAPISCELTNNFETIIISDRKLLNKFLIDIMEDLNIKYNIYDSYEEYLEKREGVINNKFIFILDKKYDEIKSKTKLDSKKIIILSENMDKKRDSRVINLKNITSNTIKKIYGINFLENGDENTDKKGLDIKKYKGIFALIVEDNQINRDYIESIFKMINIRYDSVKTIERANYLLKKNNYNMIFTDYNVNGFKITEFIRNIPKEKKKNMKIILGTGEAPENISAKLSVDSILEKPYSLANILNIMEEYFSDKQLSKNEEIEFDIDKMEYYDIFFEDIYDIINKMQEYNKMENWNDVYELAHMLKSGIYVLEEEGLKNNVVKIEQLFKEEKYNEISKEILDFKNNVFEVERNYLRVKKLNE